jgi:hypothetical protein
MGLDRPLHIHRPAYRGTMPRVNENSYTAATCFDLAFHRFQKENPLRLRGFARE